MVLLVLYCISSGECTVDICRLTQCKQGVVDICSTGKMASLLVLGTIQVLPSR